MLNLHNIMIIDNVLMSTIKLDVLMKIENNIILKT